MPYSIIKVNGGYQVASPNHPEGHSKKPMTRRNAIAQKLIMERDEFGEGNVPQMESNTHKEKAAKKLKESRKH